MVDFLTKSGSNSSIELKIVLAVLGILALGIVASGGAGIAAAQETQNNTTDANASYEWVFYTNSSYGEDIVAVNPNGEKLKIPTDVYVQSTVVDDHGRLFIVGESAVEVYNINDNSLEEVHQFNLTETAHSGSEKVAITKTDFYWMSESGSGNFDELYRYDLDDGTQERVWSWSEFYLNTDAYDFESSYQLKELSTTSSGDPLLAVHTSDSSGSKTAIINATNGEYGTLAAEHDESETANGDLTFTTNYYYAVNTISGGANTDDTIRVSIYDKYSHDLLTQSTHSHSSSDFGLGLRDSDGAYYHGVEYSNENTSELYRFDSTGKTLETNYDGGFPTDQFGETVTNITESEITAFASVNDENLSVQRLSLADGSTSSVQLISDSYVGVRAVAYTTDSAYLNYGATSGQLEVVSIEDESSDPINNTTVSVYNSSDTLVWEQTAEDAYLAPFQLEAGDYTVVANASGYSATSQNITVKTGETASISFTLSEQATPTPTPTPTEHEVIIGGGEDDDNLGILVPLGIGGLGFLFFLLLVVLGFRAQKQQRQFALLLVILVLSSAVVPMVFVGGFSGTAQAQTTTGDADQSAALIVFTLDQPAIKSDVVYAVNPSSRELAWKTEVNESTASAVANNPESDEVYALSHGNFSEKPLNITVFNKSTGEIKRTVETNITGDNFGTRTKVVDDTYYFAVGNTTYAYDADSGEVSESYSYEKSFSEAEAYDIGVSQDGDLHQLNAWSDSYTTYENGEIESTGNESIDYAYYTDDGWIAQYNSQIFMLNQSWERNLGLSTYLYDAASGPTYTYVHYGGEVYQYNASSGDREFAYTTTTPTTDSEYVDLAHMDYQSEDKHLHELTMVGTTPVGADPSGDPRIHYTVYNTTRFGDTGGSAYSARIEYQQYLDNIQDDAVGDISTSSVTIVYDVQPTTTIIGGGEDDGQSLQEMILQWVLNWIENNLGLVFVGVFGVLFVIGLIVFALTRVWNTLKMPFSVLLLPFKLVWRGLKKLVSLVS